MIKRKPTDFVDTDSVSYRDLRQMYDLNKRASVWALAGDIAMSIAIVALIASPLWLPTVATFFWGE